MTDSVVPITKTGWENTWDDAVSVVQDAILQLGKIDVADEDTDGLYLGFLQTGALMALGTLLVSRTDDPGTTCSLQDLINIAAKSIVDLEDRDDDDD